MANLQYIGARYVPVLYTNPDDQSNDWKSGVTYESLTIVTYNDDSYTSKKAVPDNIGNPADNPTYWVKTGNFNASLIALQNQVSNIDNVELPAIRDDVSDLEDSRSFNVSHRKFILIGDSLGTGDFSGNPDGGWCNYFKSFMGLTEGVDVFTTAISGKGFTNSSPNFLQMAQALTIPVPDEITHIIVLGGLNDNTDGYGAMLSAANGLYDYLHATYKNAEIYFGAIGRSRYTSSVNVNIINNVVPGLKDSKAHYIYGIENFGHEYDKYMDTWHWNDAYTEHFARILANNFESFAVSIPARATTFTKDAAFSSGDNLFPYMWQDDGMIFATGASKIFQFSTDITWGGSGVNDQTIVLGKYDSSSLVAGMGQFNIPIHGYLGFQGADFKDFAGELSFNPDGAGNFTLSLKAPAVFAGDTGYVTRTLHNFYLRGMGLSLPAAIC